MAPVPSNILVIPWEFRGNLLHHKTRVPVLSRSVVCVVLRLAVLVPLRLVTDRRTEKSNTALA